MRQFLIMLWCTFQSSITSYDPVLKCKRLPACVTSFVEGILESLEARYRSKVTINHFLTDTHTHARVIISI